MSMSIIQCKKSLSWTQFFYILAKKITARHIPETFLTSQELKCFNQALSSFEQWEIFSNDSKMANKSTQLTINQITAFRVRTMLLEQLISQFFHSDHNCCQSLIMELDQLWDQDIVDTADSPIPIMQPQIPESVSKISSHVPLLDIYHTLEFDMSAMIEQRKLEEYQAQEELQERYTTPTLIAGSDQFNLKFLLKGITENRDKTTLTDRELRHLLSEVNPHKSKWANEERAGQEELYEACEKVLIELKNYTEHSTPFLTKVNKRDAPDYFEVIKEPMDLGTVTKKLKNSQYKSKKEFAADIYLIYDNCLEYNTDPSSEYRKHANAMRRKTDKLLIRVPEIEIKDRPDHDFDDSEDEHEIVNKQILIDTSRERSVTYESADDDTPSILSSHKQYSGKMPTKGTSQSSTIIVENEELHQELDIDKGELQNQLWRDITKKTRARVATDVEKQYQFDFGNRQAIVYHSLNVTRLHLMEQLHHQPESVNKLIRCSPTTFARWMERTDLKSLEYFDLDSEDEDDFGSNFFFSKKSERPKPTDEDDALRNDLFLPEYMVAPHLPEIVGVPNIVLNEDEIDEDTDDEETKEVDLTINKRERPTFDIYPSTLPPSGGLNEIIEKNIETLNSIRSIHKKCYAIQHNLPISLPPHIPDSPNSPIMTDIGTPVPSSNPYSDTIDITKEATDQIMQKAIVQLLSHAGFESTHAQPIHILNEIVSDLFMNMGRTLRRYRDEYTHKMPTEEILLHALTENGVSGLGDLESYVNNDIRSHGSKLVELHHELEDNFHNLVDTPVNKMVYNEDAVFNDEESFTTGTFGEGAIEDFFGFKEIGIVQEHENLKIPIHLWYDQNSKNPLTDLKTKYPKYSIPPRFQPVHSSESFIGLLQPWYMKRLKDNPMEGMIEDEHRSKKQRNKPPYPPVQYRCENTKVFMSKIPRKRILKDGSNTIHQQSMIFEPTKAPIKRKKAVMDEATKAEKKRQRLELKAQKKQVEKELKKKQREELKNKEKPAKQKTKKTVPQLPEPELEPEPIPGSIEMFPIS